MDVPVWFWVAAGLLAARYLLPVLSDVWSRWGRDPQRRFDTVQRDVIHGAAGHRCEHKPMLWSRCSNRSEHADHIWPWSKRGATTVFNGQALCAYHNMSKGARVPSPLYRWRLQRRRRRYHASPNPWLSKRALRQRRPI